MGNNNALKSGVWFVSSNFIMKTIGFITTPVFTRLLTKSEFGDFNTFQTWMMLILFLTSLNLEGSLIRASQEHKKDFDGYVFSMVTLSMISTSIWWIVSNLFFIQLSNLLSLNRVYINCMFLYLFFCPIVNLFQNAERYKYKYKMTVLTNMTISVGASLLSVLLVVFLSDGLFARTIGFIIPTMIVGTIVLIYYLVKIRKVKLTYWKYALPITLPYIPHLLSMYMLSNIDRIMIDKICGSDTVALYSLAYTCGMLITILVTSVNSAYSPWLAEKLSNKEYDKIKKISVPYVAIFSYFAIGTVLVSPEILLIMGGKEYIIARLVMPPVAAGCLLQFVYCMYVNIEQYEKKTIGMASASAIAAIINIVLNYLFIPRFGYVAAAYTTYFGYLLLLIMHMFLVHKMKMDFVYNNKKMFVISLISTLTMFLGSIILEKYLIRYVILLIYSIIGIVIIYKNKDELKNIVKRN